MGVKGILPCLESITRNISLEKYRGLTAAVDAMCWLHKGVFTGDVRALAKYQRQQQQDECNKQKQEQHELVLNGKRPSSEEPESKDKCLDRHDDSCCSVVKRLDFDQFASAVKRPRYGTVVHNQNNIHVSMSLSSSCQTTNNAEAKLAMVKCADYVIRHTEQVRKNYGIEIILVIDGGPLPSKKNVDEKRRLEREDAFQKGLKADKRGDSREARKQFTRACSISHEIRHELIVQCKLKGIPFIVAPYESDAQLAKLAHDGVVDVVISEDSDLLAYGCPRVLFKIDFRSGRGDEIQIMRDLASNSSPSFRHWNHDMFVYMCILSGCDYCDGIPGIGIQTAHKIVRMHRKPSKIFKMLGSTGKLPQGFEEMFWTAYNTFRHQRIYCLEKGVIEPLFPIEEQHSSSRSSNAKEMWQFLGAWLEPSIGRGIADGSLHPVHHIPWAQIDSHSHHQNNIHSSSSSSNDKFQERMRKKQSDKSRHDVDASSRRGSLFAFFKKGSKVMSSHHHDNIKHHGQERLPLQEITLNHETDDSFHNSDSRNNTFNGNPMVPSHFYEYSSKLVSTSFQPLSRNTSTLRYFQKRKGASKAIKKLKNRLSLKKVQEIENARRSAQEQHHEVTEQEIIDNFQGSSTISSTHFFDDFGGKHKEEMTKVKQNFNEFNTDDGPQVEISHIASSLLPEDEFSRCSFPNFDYCAIPSLPLYACYSTEDRLSDDHKKNIYMNCATFGNISNHNNYDPVAQLEQRNRRKTYFSPSDNEVFHDFGDKQLLLQNVQVAEHGDGTTYCSSGMMENQQGTVFEDRFCNFDYGTFHDENRNCTTNPDELNNYLHYTEWGMIQNDNEEFIL